MKIPTDSLYQHGVPVEMAQKTTDALSSDRMALKGQVDWDTPVDTTEDRRAVTRRIATLRHYGNASKLLLCEDLWQQDHNAPLPALIEETARQTADEMTLWGKYLIRIDGGDTVPDTLKDLYRCLFSENDPVTVLMGITTLNMMARGGFLELRDEGDALFNAIAATLADDMDSQLTPLIGPYQTVVGARSATEREEMLTTLASFIDHAGRVVRHDSTDFPVKKWDDEQRWHQVGEPVKQFYQRIGLTDGIL